MEEDTKNNLTKYQHIYNIMLNKINNLLEENLKNEDFQNQTFLPNEFVYYNDEWNHLNYTNLDNDYQLSKMGQEYPEIFKLIRSKKFQDNFYNKHHNKTKEDDKKHNDNI